MTQRNLIAVLTLAAGMSLIPEAVAGTPTGKTLYIPREWQARRTDTLLYHDLDPERRYTWSRSRSRESANFVCYWDKQYAVAPDSLPSSDFYYVDVDDLLAKAEAFYALNAGRLQFCDEAASKVGRHKMMILLNHTATWTCYGAGYDFMAGALWLNPSTCKPVGHSVAHEVGHSFQYMCYSDLGGHCGFHDAIGSGSTFWEQTAQWQANQSYPDQMWAQGWDVFRRTSHYAMTHEWHRYQSFWWHYYLAGRYGIGFIGRLWRHPVPEAADANQVLMHLLGIDDRELYRLYFDYALHMATLDVPDLLPGSASRVGGYVFRSVALGDGRHQVQYASCPQSTGFNVIELRVPEGGGEVSTRFTSLPASSPLAPGDPAEYIGPDHRLVPSGSGRYHTVEDYDQLRGFRLGYVALMADGTRTYLAADSLYCADGRAGAVTADVPCVVPAGTSRLFLVVVPAPHTYLQHLWDERIADDDQWPYQLQFTGTDLARPAPPVASGSLHAVVRPLIGKPSVAVRNRCKGIASRGQ